MDEWSINALYTHNDMMVKLRQYKLGDLISQIIPQQSFVINDSIIIENNGQLEIIINNETYELYDEALYDNGHIKTFVKKHNMTVDEFCNEIIYMKEIIDESLFY